jgi:proteasome assembly chaperone (PAC2) family protein
MTYTLESKPVMEAPVMVSALAGWVDAGGVGTGAAGHLAGEGAVVARFDSDELFDYRSQRPILDIVDGTMKRTVWPEVVLRHSNVAGRDLLTLTGLEPDLAWKRFSAAVAELAVRFEIEQLVTFGSVPAAVPHTLPPPILTTASDPDLLAGEIRPPQGLLRVPAAAVSMVDQHVAKSGRPTVGFFVQVPHYVTGTYPPGVLALLQRLALHLGMEIPLESLEEDAKAHHAQLDEAVADQPEAREHIQALEKMQAEQNVVSGEELASEIERYLRNAPPPGDGGAPGAPEAE